jgi:acyl-CoA dehydrogenase
MALTHARFTQRPVEGPTGRYYQHIVRFSASFAFAVDVAMLTLGGYLKKKENLSARLGDVLSCMYLASMVLKHHENQGRPQEDLPIVEWACRNLLYHAQEQLHGFLRNFPNRFLAGVMMALILPRGRAYSAPGDRLGRKVADLVMNPTEARERLCQYMYWTLEPTNPFGLLQEALLLAQNVEPLEKRIRVEGVKTGRVTALDFPSQIQQALVAGIISEAEAVALREYDRKVMDILNVDDFAQHELGTQAEPVPQQVPEQAPVRSSVHVA